MSPGGFLLATAGAFISFLPLLQILLPLKAAEIAPGAATATLGRIAAAGALIAGLSNFGVGWLSDRTRSRFGRRRPWILGGVLGVLLSYALLWRAQSVPALFAAFAAFQIAFNTMFSPLLALVPDRVEPSRRGRISALIALGTPIGTLIGAVVIGSLLRNADMRWLALAAIVAATIIPFALTLGADPPPPASLDRKAGPAPRSPRNFLLGWIARVCVLVAFSIAQLYILFYVQTMHPRDQPSAITAEVATMGVVFGIASAASGILSGLASDRSGRRKPIVIGAALVVAAGMLILAIAPSWPVSVIGYALFAAGAGTHVAVEFALMVDLLPSPDRAARDLGLLNLSNIIPQIVAPLGMAWIVSLPGGSVHAGFAAGAATAAIGAGLLGLMRAVP